MLNRPHRRAIEREHDRLLSKHAIPAPPLLMHGAAMTRRLIHILQDKTKSLRASDAAIEANRLFDSSLKNHPPPPTIACRAGCAYCCHIYASCSIPEALWIARFIREHRKDFGSEFRELFLEMEARTRGKNQDTRLGLQIPCPLLRTELCSVYPVRPLSCRGFASLDVHACMSIVSGGNADVPIPMSHGTFRPTYSMTLHAALSHCGLEYRSVELGHAVWVALETPNCEERWLSNEDVFAVVARDATNSQENQAIWDHNISRILKAVRWEGIQDPADLQVPMFLFPGSPTVLHTRP